MLSYGFIHGVNVASCSTLFDLFKCFCVGVHNIEEKCDNLLSNAVFSMLYHNAFSL